MRRTEPGTATVAVALGVGLSALGKQLGLGPVPPGLLQSLAPIVDVVGREAAQRAARTTIVAVIALSPAWAWVGAAPFDSGFHAGDVLEGSTARMAAFARDVALLLIVAGVGVLMAFGVVPAAVAAIRDRTMRWNARARALFIGREAPRGSARPVWSRLPRGAASEKPPREWGADGLRRRAMSGIRSAHFA